MNTCPAVKATGEVCANRCRGGDPRCGTHMNALRTYGPHTTAQRELKYTHRAILKRIEHEGVDIAEREPNNILRERMIDDLHHRIRLLKVTQQHEFELLLREQEDEIRQTGIDPDAGPRERRQAQERQRNIQRQLQWEHHNEIMRQNPNFLNGRPIMVDAGGVLVNAVVAVNVVARGELEAFAHDNQNVHTTTAVRHTKDMVQKILAIPVPEEYRWCVSECSKTPGDIIMCCKLTPKGAWQMASKYCQDEDIYEMGRGIYGKVLDGVWQYVSKSSDKDDLCKIIKQEMEDNIGMCAQGNLTRLCNILSGYMEGIGVQESPSEILGRKLPLLMEIENVYERINQAYNLMVELAIPREQWLSWVEPLVESGSVSFRVNVGGEVVGLMVV